MAILSRDSAHNPDHRILQPLPPVVLDFTASGPSQSNGPNWFYLTVNPPIDPATGNNFRVIYISTTTQYPCWVSMGQTPADVGQSLTAGAYTMNSMYIPANKLIRLKVDTTDTVISVAVESQNPNRYVCIGGVT